MAAERKRIEDEEKERKRIASLTSAQLAIENINLISNKASSMIARMEDT